ncbi:MAG: Unknown protein, partial [uncultured Sulfurovum sp.]
MNDVTLSIYTLLQDIFKNVWEQQKYSEVKNGVLLTLNIAMFAIIVRVYFQAKEVVNSSTYSKVIFFILLILFIIHIVLIIQSFFPKDSNKEDFKEAKNINIFFFGDIQKVKSTHYLELIIKKIKPEKIEEINKASLLDLSNQIV